MDNLPDCMYEYRPSNIIEDDDDNYKRCRHCEQLTHINELDEYDGLCQSCFEEEEWIMYDSKL